MNKQNGYKNRFGARGLAILMGAIFAFAAAPALAGTPVQVPVQGLLTDADGQAVDGATQVTFRIYADATSTAAVWESELSLQVDNGLFEANLGAGDELDSDIFSAHPTAHLSITIAGDEESERIRLGAVPTAAHAMSANFAEDAHTLQGKTPQELLQDVGAAQVGFDDAQAGLGTDTTQGALEALLQRVEALEQQRQALQAQVDANGSQVAALDSRVGDVESATGGFQSQIDSLQSDVNGYNSAISGLQSDVTGHDSAISGLQGDVRGHTSAISSLQSDVTGYTSAISGLQSTVSGHDSAISGLQSTVSGHDSAITGLQSEVSGHDSAISSLQSNVSDNDSAISALETKTASMSATTIGGKSAVTFDGVNVYVRNGTGSTTGTPNGTGNLVVGYDEARSTDSDKSGSHNLVLGRRHNYSSYGGIVAGDENDITASYASVLGGTYNTASGSTAVVVSGYRGVASGFRSAVVSGWDNVADGSYSAVLAGDSNKTTANESGIGGGIGVVNNNTSKFTAQGTVSP